jgi:hypothetical protein
MAERTLPVRRRKKADPGKPIRVSKLVFATLDKDRGRLSWDCFFRRMLGLPTRKGKEQPLIEGALDPHSGILTLRLNGTSWREVEDVARQIGEHSASFHRRPSQSPIRMREIR